MIRLKAYGTVNRRTNRKTGLTRKLPGSSVVYKELAIADKAGKLIFSGVAD